MSIRKRLENKFEAVLVDLPEKDQKIFRTLKKVMVDWYEKYVMPIALGLATFWIFSRLKTRLGLEDTLFIIAVVIIIYLKGMAKNIGKLVED